MANRYIRIRYMRVSLYDNIFRPPMVLSVFQCCTCTGDKTDWHPISCPNRIIITDDPLPAVVHSASGSGRIVPVCGVHGIVPQSDDGTYHTALH